MVAASRRRRPKFTGQNVGFRDQSSNTCFTWHVHKLLDQIAKSAAVLPENRRFPTKCAAKRTNPALSCPTSIGTSLAASVGNHKTLRFSRCLRGRPSGATIGEVAEWSKATV